jgi:hypothetical protein
LAKPGQLTKLASASGSASVETTTPKKNKGVSAETINGKKLKAK